MIKRLLVANRGEIARRVLRTCRELGIETVAVYSEPDAGLPHVLEADQAICLGPAPAAQSYLNVDALMAAVRESGADAVHPGYGFLSENTGFAQACTDAGIIFVGPAPDAIRLMGDKAAARRRMADSGVPVLPGLDEPGADDDTLRDAADDIGFPLLIKAVAGGGGKGMRVVNAATEFDEALASARREAKSAFGDDRVLLERYLAAARHVEVQVFGDNHGNAVHLFERDCSVQRRHQKIIEEAPAPGLSDNLRTEMGQAAVRAAKAIGYQGAGTVEFLLDPEGRFYFMEMNTRLQVEHPVTEMITGEDLVAWQLMIAAGGELPLRQEQLSISGHAMEVRVYAEDPGNHFLPSSGTLQVAHWPAQARVDSGFEQGDPVSDQYDPMLAKIIVHGSDRESARRKLCSALRDTRLAGVRHNLGFLLRVLESQPFANAELDTRLLEHHPDLQQAPEREDDLLLAAGVTTLATQANSNGDVWDNLRGWRALGETRFTIRLGMDGEARLVSLVQPREGDPMLEIDGRTLPVDWRPGRVKLADGPWREFRGEDHDGRLLVFLDGVPWPVDIDPSPDLLAAEQAAGEPFAAPMSGTLVQYHVDAGATVAAGDAVVTMEAMKMEHTLRAPADGTVVALPFAAGDTVSEGQILAEFEQEAADE